MRACRTVADLAGLAALDLVRVDGTTEPIPAFLAERLLAPRAAAGAAAGAAGARVARRRSELAACGHRGGPPGRNAGNRR